MAAAPRTKGPWTHRLLVLLLTAAVTVLLYWLLGFAVRDIGSIPGPDREAFERARLEPQLLSDQEGLAKRGEELRRQIQGLQERQELLRRSTDNSRETMTQLLEMQRLALEKGVRPSAAEQAALAESQQLFLGNQRAFQDLNEEIVRLTAEAREVQRTSELHAQAVEAQRAPLRAEFDRRARQHELRLAGLQLLLLLPLLGGAVYAFLRWRRNVFAPLVHAAGIAVLVKVAEVVHQHFPSRFFKYVALLAVLAVVVRLLVALLRNAARPGGDWLLRRHREAYERFRCPSCDFPIRRGPLRFLLRTRKGLVNLAAGSGADAAPEPYTCPACGVRLYEPCDACHAVRPALLPWCDRCGAEKPSSA